MTPRGPKANRREQRLERLRTLCLALPEAHEKIAWGDPTFRVRDKIFAMHKVGDGRQSIWCKADPFERDALVEQDSDTFYVPPYVGHKGWIGVRLDSEQLDWEAVARIVTDSYRRIAPKTLAAQIATPSRGAKPTSSARPRKSGQSRPRS